MPADRMFALSLAMGRLLIKAGPQPYKSSQPHVLKGAGRGAALGAVGGAITAKILTSAA
jgi:hypothetical protein